MHAANLAAVLGVLGESAEADRSGVERAREATDPVIETEFQIRRRGAKARLVLTGEERNLDPKLIAAVADAHHRFADLRSGRYGSLRELARETGLDRSDIGRRIRFAFLAPDIVEAILEGRQPADLNLTRLKRLGQLPLSWPEQRSLLGFAS